MNYDFVHFTNLPFFINKIRHTIFLLTKFDNDKKILGYVTFVKNRTFNVLLIN